MKTVYADFEDIEHFCVSAMCESDVVFKDEIVLVKDDEGNSCQGRVMFSDPGSGISTVFLVLNTFTTPD